MTDIASSQTARHAGLLEDYLEFLPLAQRVQQELSDTAQELADQQGFSQDVCAGLDEWILADLGVSWRALRRARFDPDKAQSLLLDALTARVQHSLHEPLPHLPPYNDPSLHRSTSSTPPLFTFLPPSTCTDRLNRPIAVLTLEQVQRNGDGSLDGLKQLGWWTAEMGRRVVNDWYGQASGAGWVERGRKRAKRDLKGKGRDLGLVSQQGGGYVLLVDAKGAGFKNLEFELLPTLINIHHNHFPGLVESVFVVNYTWTHAGLWAGLKRVLPTVALEKIVFLNGDQQTSQIFDLDVLPKPYGGRAEYDISTAPDLVFRKYSGAPGGSRSVSRSSSVSSAGYSRQGSVESIADIFYSAGATPNQSIPSSPTSGPNRTPGPSGRRINLRMTKASSKPFGLNALGLEATTVPPRKLSIKIPQQGKDGTTPSSLSRSRSASPQPKTPLERIKSMTDFRLYLGSQRANIDLLLGSDDEDDSAPRKPSIIERRRQRSPLKSPTESAGGGSGVKINQEEARSYSASLSRRYKKVLSESCLVPEAGLEPQRVSSDPSIGSAAAPPLSSTSGAPQRPTEQPIGAYDTSNPMFGYPVVRSSSSLKPRYGRKRKRDLAKTLLFLFLLRLVSLREWIEVFLASFRIGNWSLFGSNTKAKKKRRTPETAFSSGKEVAKRNDSDGQESSVDKNIIWLAVLMLVIRGSLPESLGLDKVLVLGWEGWERARGMLAGGFNS